MVSQVFLIFVWILFAYCSVSVVYLLFFSVAGNFYKTKKRIETGKRNNFNRIALLVPAYKEDAIILSTAKNLVQLDYPKNLYDVYIIADSFDQKTINELRKLPVQVIEVFFEKSTKTKALNETFCRIEKEYEVALVCDADNMLPKDFLNILNKAFLEGSKAVQGRRVAKNLDSSFAILDAVSEGINNHIFRKGPNALGLSSSVIGSGMAFEFNLLKRILKDIDAVGGFDKILQLKVVAEGLTIQYLNEALIFDEKVESSAAFEQQRKRWISSQFIYLKKFFISSILYLLKGNISYFNLALLNNLVPPRALLFLLLPVLIILGYFTSYFILAAGFCLLIAYILTLLIAIPHELFTIQLLKSVMLLPKAIFLMAGNVFKVKNANKTFIHTVHSKTTVSNILFENAKQ